MEGMDATMSEVLHHFQSASRKEPIGVCLWGPPGCGKSSAIAQIEAVTGTNSDDLMIINSDDWTVFLAKTYFADTYRSFIHAREVTNAHHTAYASSEDELVFWRMVMDTPYPRLLQTENNTLPRDMFDVYAKYFLEKFSSVLMPNTWERFWENPPSDATGVLNRTLSSPRNILYALAPMQAKEKRRTFVMEYAGRFFDRDGLQLNFLGIRNLLYIPFIDNMALLQNRVAQRNQFGSPNIDVIPEFYTRAYGDSLLRAIESRIFDQILIESNNIHRFVMLSLERLPDGHYILAREAANTKEEALYIKAILQALLVPEVLHGTSNLKYDTSTSKWSFVFHPQAAL